MPYGFIYVTTCKVNGKKYIGQRKYSHGWQSYLGSGQAFRNAVRKYGTHSFSREIICEAETPEELNQLEYEYTVKFDVVNSDDWYNLCYGGNATHGYKFSEETKKVMSAKKKGVYDGEKNPMYGVHRKHTEEELKRIVPYLSSSKDQSGEKNINFGKTYGENPRAKSVVCVELDKVFDSAKRASHELGINHNSIIAVCKGKRNRAGGYHFKYANTEITA